MSDSSKRKFKSVPAEKIHYSALLPTREYNEDFVESIKKTGIQQPLIVRPLPNTADEYEMIDGRGRLDAVEDKQKEVLVDVRYNTKDLDVFQISEATFLRTERSAYDRALFIEKWAKTLEGETGENKGVQALLARQTGLSESAISEYTSIYCLFEKLKSLVDAEEFNALKSGLRSWGVNKLYKLSELLESPNLLDVVRALAKKHHVSVQQIGRLVAENAPMNPAMALLDDEIIQNGQTKRAHVIAEKVNSLATETHQILIGLADEVLRSIDQFSSIEILDSFDNVLHTLERLRKHVETLRRKIDQTPKPDFQEKSQEGKKTDVEKRETGAVEPSSTP